MKKLIKNWQNLFLGLLLLMNYTAEGQCLSLISPPSVTLSTTSGSCGTIVNFTSPTVVATCSVENAIFNYTGSIQNWTVPAGISVVTITAKGAQGGFNTSSPVGSGLGAQISGIFAVSPGQVLKILVGEQPSSNAGNGGGGGSFVTDLSNSPWIIAGGGGGSAQGSDSPSKHGQATTAGGAGAGNGGNGGVSGNGGAIGASGFQAGAGGGLLTNGSDGWTTGTGGMAFVNGGAGAPTNSPARGGFGGGGSGSSYVVGGGGGGYSGGGSGGNSTAGVGGGGGSFNGGTSQVNTSGVNAGHGQVVINYTVPYTYTFVQTAGQASGSLFLPGTTVQTFSVSDSFSNTAVSSFSVTIQDLQTPTITCPGSTTSCVPVVTGIAPAGIADNCGSPAVTYTFSGATSGSGTSNASGTAFNLGITSVTYIATDNSGNKGSCSFSVTVNPIPSVTATSNYTAICEGYTASLTAIGADTYSWGAAGSGSVISVSPLSTTQYTVTGTTTAGCSNTFAITQVVNQNPTVTAASNFSVVCEGETATITAAGADTYSWSTGATGSLIVVSPATTTAYIVTGTNVHGCTNTLSITHSVNPLPVVSVISATNTSCSGDPIFLQAAGADTYSWSTGDTGDHIAPIAFTNTVFSVTGTNTLSGCSSTFALTQSVNPSPTVAATSNYSAFCQGNSTTLTANGSDSYQWSSGAITSTAVVSPSVSTIFIVTGTETLTGCAGQATIGVIVYANPNVLASGTGTSCIGGVGYIFLAGANTYSTIEGPSGATLAISPTVNTTYTITGYDANGCSATAVFSQEVVPSPTVTITSGIPTICVGESTLLNASGADEYTWSNGVTSATVVVNPPATQEYTLTGTSNGCSSKATFTVNVLECTGISAHKESELYVMVYPNPNNGEIHINYNSPEENIKLQIYTALGTLVAEKENLIPGSTLDITYLPNGVYYIRLSAGNRLMDTQRIIKQD